MLDRWTRVVLRYRVIVVATWVVIAVLGLWSSSGLNSLLSTSLAVPGTDSARAAAILSTHFEQNIEGTFTVVLPFQQATTAQIAALEAKIAVATTSVATGRVTQEKAVVGVLYANIATSLDLIHASAQTDGLRRALAREGLGRALVTGPPALNHDLTPVLTGDLRTGEIMAVALALLLLLAVLGLCWALLAPFIVAAMTATASIAITYVLAHHFLMVLYIPNVIELIGLGLAIDYSLLIVHRFRTEISEPGITVDDAVVSTMTTAGRTVVLSGLTVAIGLATLLLVPVPFVRSLGAAGLVVPVVAIVVALTLQPVLLSLLGRRGVEPRVLTGLIAGDDLLGGLWKRITRRVLARPVAVLVISLVVLSLAATSMLWLQLTPGSVSAVPNGLASARAITLIRDRAGPGVISPIDVVIDLGPGVVASDPAAEAAKVRFATAVSRNPEVFAAAIDTKAPFVDSTGRYELVVVVGRHDLGAQTTKDLVHQLLANYVPGAKFPPGTKVVVGGAPAQGVDFLASVYGIFPWIGLLALLLSYVVLLRAFRSVLLALVAVVLDLVSVAVAFGLLVLVFRCGVGSALLGTYQVSQIEGWVPMFLFAMLFGLSMDYEVFIVSRMREARDRGLSSLESITEGLVRTGGVVSAAAVIFVGALSGLVFGHIAGLQELGVGLSLGVLIDATIVRGLVLPSVMALMGERNWWLPEGVARIAHITAPPSAERTTGP